MGWLKAVIATYAVLNIGGGIEGFITKHSVASIMSGVTAGILLVVGMALASSNQKVGFGLCALIALGDLGFFGSTIARKGFALWPAGIMAGASILVLVCLVAAHFGSKGS